MQLPSPFDRHRQQMVNSFETDYNNCSAVHMKNSIKTAIYVVHCEMVSGSKQRVCSLAVGMVRDIHVNMTGK